MKIGMGTTVWARGLENGRMDGIAYYTQEIFRRTVNKADSCEPVVWGQPSAENLDDQKITYLGSYKKAALLSSLAGVEFAGGASLANRLDLFHATDHYTPKFRGLPVVASLMDAIPLSHPHWVSSSFRRQKNWLWRKSAHWANHIITLSEFSKSEISKHFDIPESRISVTPLGVDARYFDRLTGGVVDAVVNRYDLPFNFFLFVGTFQPRKNLERLISAHEALPSKIRHEFPLILVGRSGWGCDNLLARLGNYTAEGGSVRWLQNVDDLEKRVMMQRATALVFPSLLEGFGLPVLEGFASQTPVICSNTSSLPEVAADAAWLVDPLSQNAMTEAMHTLAQKPQVAYESVAKGLIRARNMSWDTCAEKTFQVYQRILGKS
jgi:glycosyltransferase involved in cell wall biosynthesis